MSRKRNLIQLFTPTQFASCLESGLNIHVFAGEASTRKCVGDGGSKTSLKRNESTEDKDVTRDDTDDNSTIIATDQQSTATTAIAFSPVSCTNGAMEALRQCQSAFVSMLSTSLGGELKNNDRGILTEHDIMSCLKKMGLSHLASRGASLLSSSQETQQQSQSQTKKRKGASIKTLFSNVSETQLKKLVEEQERLLSESACRVRTMMMINPNQEFVSESTKADDK